MISYAEVPIQQVQADWLEKAQVRLVVRREDLNHPLVSGNKWWKLKYNLAEAKEAGHKRLLTFGGAYSNHIFATAAAAKESGLECIGVVRGEETLPLNPTLSFAIRQGMVLHYVTREVYRRKTEPAFVGGLKREFGEFYLIPEGGTNELALKGCAELAKEILKTDFDYLCLPVGTGGTMAGILSGFQGKRQVIGFSVLKDGSFLNDTIRSLIPEVNGYPTWRIESNYHFGGYAKKTEELETFILDFFRDSGIPLEPVYAGKMMFGICDLVKRGYFEKGATVMALHTGGLMTRILTQE